MARGRRFDSGRLHHFICFIFLFNSISACQIWILFDIPCFFVPCYTSQFRTFTLVFTWGQLIGEHGMKSYLELKAITEPGFYNAGDTLYLSVKKSGSKSWIQRLTIDGKRCDMGLGSFKLVTLSEARDKAYGHRKAVRQGCHPLAEKRKAKRPSFQKAATQTFEALKPSWRNGKHTKTWMQAMEKYVFPVIGSTRIDQLGREDVLRILTPLWTKRPETARRLRQKMRQTFRWAQAHGYIEK